MMSNNVACVRTIQFNRDKSFDTVKGTSVFGYGHFSPPLFLFLSTVEMATDESRIASSTTFHAQTLDPKTYALSRCLSILSMWNVNDETFSSIVDMLRQSWKQSILIAFEQQKNSWIFSHFFLPSNNHNSQSRVTEPYKSSGWHCNCEK